MLSRIRVPELMDDPNVDPLAHQEALAGLTRLNAFSASATLLWTELQTLDISQMRILDIATGSGDIPIALCKLAKKHGKKLDIVASDMSETALKIAREKAAAAHAEIEFRRLDIFEDRLPEGFDAVVCSLFTHHLDPPEVVQLMSSMAHATKSLVLVNDLIRSELAYALVWFGTRLLTKSKIVRYDGPVSVRAAYTTDEMAEMGEQAGLAGCVVTQHAQVRQLLSWKKQL